MIQSLERSKNHLEGFPLNAQVPENSSPKTTNWPSCNIFPRFPPCHTNLPPCHRDPKALGFSSSPGLQDHMKFGGSQTIRKLSQREKKPATATNDALGRPYGSFDNGLFFKGHFYKTKHGTFKTRTIILSPSGDTIELRKLRLPVEHSSTTQQIQSWFQGPQYWDPFMASFLYYFHTIPISLGILMGVVWE